MHSTIMHKDDTNLQLFEHALGEYFHTTQGRGKNCKVEIYKRHDLDYFFAYPEDYSQANIEWKENILTRRSHHPAFEVIFVYSQKEGELDMYLSGDRKSIEDLQKIFSQIILNMALTLNDKDQRVYDLNHFRSRDIYFKYLPESGIKSVSVKRLRLILFDPNAKITLETGHSNNPHAIYDLLEEMLPHAPAFNINQVSIKVVFHPSTIGKKEKTRTFSLTYPNCCSLKYDERSAAIRKMLIDSSIEPKLPQTETEQNLRQQKPNVTKRATADENSE